MATSRKTRIAIWIIAIVMAVGTIGSFLVIILANANQKNDQARLTELTAAYQKEYEAYQAKVDAQTTELSNKYFAELDQYSNRVGTFDASSVTDLQTEDLKVGDGADITADSSFTAYYIGWNPSGKIFDSSISEGKLIEPYYVVPGGVIEGWTKGAVGMKVGGIRELTIPSSMAYAEQGKGDDIPANTPLKFILMIIPDPEKFTQPQPSAELLKLYEQQNR